MPGCPSPRSSRKRPQPRWSCRGRSCCWRERGLVRVSRGRLPPARLGQAYADWPDGLWPAHCGSAAVGKREFERHAGWVARLVAGSGAPVEHWWDLVADLLPALGWRHASDYSYPSAMSPTHEAL
jgi:hypothetical protein